MKRVAFSYIEVLVDIALRVGPKNVEVECHDFLNVVILGLKSDIIGMLEAVRCCAWRPAGFIYETNCIYID